MIVENGIHLALQRLFDSLHDAVDNIMVGETGAEETFADFELDSPCNFNDGNNQLAISSSAVGLGRRRLAASFRWDELDDHAAALAEVCLSDSEMLNRQAFEAFTSEYNDAQIEFEFLIVVVNE